MAQVMMKKGSKTVISKQIAGMQKLFSHIYTMRDWAFIPPVEVALFRQKMDRCYVSENYLSARLFMK